MRTLGLVVGLALACGAFALACRVHALEGEMLALQTSQEAALQDAWRWKAAYEKARDGQDALKAQAQACLDRESAALADAELWRGIFEDMTTRAMSAEEKCEVPDDATRCALLDSLDRPL